MKLTPEELANNALNPATFASAVRQVKVNGYVVFESVLPADLVQELHSDYMAIYERHIVDPGPTFSVNHYRIYLPFRPPFSDPRIVDSPFVVPIMEALLGVDMVCHYFASNTCAPGSEYQPVHSDSMPLFPEEGIRPPAYFVVLNIPLVDTTKENGPIEFWPGGTHFNTVSREEMDALAPVMPSQLALMPAGSLMIRDGRMWHRGTRNRSKAPRPNIAIAYSRPWLDTGPKRTGIPQEIYDGLSDRAKAIFKHENVGGPLDGSR